MAAIDPLRRGRRRLDLGAFAERQAHGIGIAARDAAAGVDDRRLARARRARKAPAQAPSLEQPRGLGARPDAHERAARLRARPLSQGRLVTLLDGQGRIHHCDSFMTDSAHLSSGVLAAVLGAAVLHALWNSLVKSASDKFLTSAIVAIWCGVAALAAALILPRPAGAAMPFIVASAAVHIVYFLLVGRLYHSADLSVAYPMMRGLAPLIAAVIALATLGEAPGPIASLGVGALVAGVLTMGASGLAHGRIDRSTIVVAITNSAVIAVYSVIDGQGARLSGAGAAFAFAYNSWADALTALAYLPIILCLRGRAVAYAFSQGWRRGLIGGLAAFVGYAIVVWAMTRAPIASVAALRETSVVFAAIIGVVVLGEPFHRQRAIAALVILAGIILLRIG